ncbi:hypothetical protein V1639_15130 [Pseudarthrobacter sp. J75]|uniref:hypothetical protein n=1 Tax=unclassified Pseudarthrobacter TaxID=2647000 RepID=UPI002E80015E|nr:MULTISPECIES: hypothetical protein [unclassified Pseudarthrobacter]MEE2524074.1 hypothetical protein [Pseudarthrobacter sp. J47]MEE2530353.1 hypothetical protein [Pseudarthrobacter sp. J75]
MSGSESRKPLIVVGVCAVIAVLVLVSGVSCGGGNDDDGDAAKEWQQSFSGVAGGAELMIADLEVNGGNCTAAESLLKVTGTCVFVVRDFGAAFGLGPPTKRGTLVPQQDVAIELFVQDSRIEQDVEAGEEIPLTFGTSGGRLGVTCPSVGGCTLQLMEAGG